MSRLLRAFGPLIAKVDGGARLARPPTPAEDGTHFPDAEWDLRTVIAVFDAEAPFRFLNLNTALGLTGLPFDQSRHWGGPPGAAFDMQFCLQGRERAATYKHYHHVGRELESTPGAVSLRLGDRLRFEGGFPHYQIEWNQPEQELSLGIELEAAGDVLHWAWAPRYFCHYTSFVQCTLSWRWGRESGELSAPALCDHGWGRRAPWPAALGVFRYDVLRLPRDDIAIGLWTEGPGGLTLRNAGVVRRGGHTTQTSYSCRVEKLDSFDNYAGARRYVPASWTVELKSAEGTLRYHARRASDPQAVVGDGFLSAFDYEAEGTGAWSGSFRGEGYAEQLGARWSTNRRAPRGTAS